MIYLKNPPLMAKGRLAAYAASSWYYACEKDVHGLWNLNQAWGHAPREGSWCIILGDLQAHYPIGSWGHKLQWYPVLVEEQVLAIFADHLDFYDKP